MADVVDVVIPVEAEAAALLDARKRAAVGWIVSRILMAQADHDPLMDALDRLGADSKAKGLTAELLEAEVAAHKAEQTYLSSMRYSRCCTAQDWRDSSTRI
jgi:hypothetical protein